MARIEGQDAPFRGFAERVRSGDQAGPGSRPAASAGDEVERNRPTAGPFGPTAINPQMIPAGATFRAASLLTVHDNAKPRPGALNPPIGDTLVDTGAQYGPVAGQPFIAGFGDASDIEPNDVMQGALGDCYLMAALAAVAQQDPERLRRMIQANPDGTYTVTLSIRQPPTFEYGPLPILVGPELPLVRGRPAFAQTVDSGGEGDVELWVALIEKAYAKLNGSYEQIEGGWGEDALERIVGRNFDKVSPSSTSPGALARAHFAGSPITASTISDGHGKRLFLEGRLIANHEYWVESIDLSAGTLTLRNPWGYDRGPVTLSWDEFVSAFRKVSYARS